jgi:hypothetical protein
MNKVISQNYSNNETVKKIVNILFRYYKSENVTINKIEFITKSYYFDNNFSTFYNNLFKIIPKLYNQYSDAVKDKKLLYDTLSQLKSDKDYIAKNISVFFINSLENKQLFDKIDSDVKTLSESNKIMDSLMLKYIYLIDEKIRTTNTSASKGGKLNKPSHRRTKKASKRSTKKRVQKRVRRTRR